MTAGALGLAWGALAFMALARRRPAPPRVRALCDGVRPAKESPRRSPLEVVGRALLRLAGRGPSSRSQARLVGAATVATAVLLVVAPVLSPVPAAGAWALPWLAARRHRQRRLRCLEADLPETVDLLALAVGAGCNVSLAVAAAGCRGTGPLATELRKLTEEVARGRRLADALDDLPRRAGEATRPLAAALAGCERYGAPLGPTLERIADEVRRQCQRRAEESARKVPVALLFPLVLCILPAFALLTVAPLIAGALGELRL